MLPASTRFGPYEIVAPLGSGGMGEVYRARDTRLGREVALKLLQPDFYADAERLARFEREAKAVAALAHPNILVLYDVGTDHGVPFAVTELLEGRTLRQAMATAALPWRRACEIAAAIADGLAAAHAKGIVHRDVKPENVFLTADERVKVLDFGLAKIGPAGDGGASATRPYDPANTAPGAVLGTAPYMPPERLRGLEVDERGDLFSLGCVLYEMLARRRPFEGKTYEELIAAILYTEPPELGDTGANLPRQLDPVVRRCLAKNPDGRFQSARDLAFALRALLADASTARPQTAFEGALRRGARLLPALFGVALASGLYCFAPALPGLERGAGDSTSAPSPIDSIAILPLVNEARDAAAEYLCDGVPRTMIRNFLEIPELEVRPFSSVAHCARLAAPDPRAIGRQLEVAAVLAGTIALGVDGLVVTVELVDVQRNRSLWLQSYDLRQDLLAIQDDVLGAVAAKRGWQLSPPQRERLGRRPTQDTAAYLEYLEGLHAVHQWTVQDTRRGIGRLERALARDPHFALAHAALADAYIAAAYIFMEPRVAFEKARQSADEALAEDPALAEALAARATVKFHADWDWAGAERDFEEALRLNPRCAFAHDYYGWYWIARGRPDRAIAAVERAVELEPRSTLYNPDLAFVYQHARRFDDAERQARRTLEIDEQNAMAPWALALVLAHRDQDYAGALRQAEIFVERDPDRPDGLAMLGFIHGMAGEREQALAILERLERLSDVVYVRAEARAWVLAALGDLDGAFRELTHLCDERSPGIIYLRLDPMLDRVRSDPRYGELLRRVGLHAEG